MLCMNCGKKEAKFTYKEMIEGKITEIHLCEICAKQKGIQGSSESGAFYPGSILSGIIANLTSTSAGDDLLLCNVCHLSFGDFKKTGKLGCANCYVSFGKELAPLLRRIHGSLVHNGKIPLSLDRSARVRRKAKKLREELRKAIESEEFERAAELRDELKRVENN